MTHSALQNMRKSTVLFNIFIAFWLSACSAPAPLAPVSDVRQPPPLQLQQHVVASGETLYSIAWRYNLNHRELAAANGIGGNYTIYPGQRLSLDLSQKPASARQSERPAQVAKTTPAKPAPAPKTAPARSKKQTVATKPPTPVISGSDPSAWRWPVEGTILEQFQANGGLNKGIDIGGKLGEPVRAAATGNVVYSGSGLRGYGNLIIVKHSEKYLSAYAHNSTLLVKEGDSVKSGQQIAELGSSEADQAKLHFEIRYDGKPVNPLKYLPRR